MERDIRLLKYLASMPFLDRLELAAVSDVPDRTMHDVVANLKERGLVSWVRHSTDFIFTTRRLYVTPLGIETLAEEDKTSLGGLMQRYPISSHWQRNLLARLDAVGVINRLAACVGILGGALHRFRWYRQSPLDAGMVLSDGRTIGILRQGSTTEKTGFSKRIWRLLERDIQGLDALMVIVPDMMRMRHTRGLLRRTLVPVFLALEKDVAEGIARAKIWRFPSAGAVIDLPFIMKHMSTKGILPDEQPLARPLMPKEIEKLDDDLYVPDYLLPVVLKPALKRTMDILADWPWITHKDLSGILGVTAQRTSQLTIPLVSAQLARRIHMNGRERLALTEWGLAMLARRDRTSVGRLRSQWSVEPVNEKAPLTWRNVTGRRSRLLARNMEHSQSVHGFLAQLMGQAKSKHYTVELLEPPHKATRYFRHNQKVRSVHPDAFGIVRKKDKILPFFLEWERRAVRPGTMADRLAPYLRYYSSYNPIDDHGAWPLVLIVFDDMLVESNFHSVARREMARTGVELPLWVSHKEMIEKEGPLGRAWRNPDFLEYTDAFALASS